MNALKKLGRVLLPMVMIFALSIPALAEEATGKIIIKNPQADATYSIYKIFDVSSSGGEYTYTIESDSNAYTVVTDYITQNGDSGLELTQSGTGTSTTYLVGFDDSEFSAPDFAEYLKTNIGALGDAVQENTVSADASGNVSVDAFTNLPLGYYFVSTTTGSLCGLTTVNAEISIYDKNVEPDIDKKIDNGDGVIDDGDTTMNTASVGEEIPFVLESEVPDMTGYTKYYFIVEDTLSKGLTYNDDIVIKIGDTTLTKGTDYTFSTVTGEDDSTEMKIVFKNFIQYQPNSVGEKISITYSATVNQDAEIGNNENTNEVKLIYSNNPGVTNGGEDEPEIPDNPGDDFENPVGETPTKTTYTYTTGIKLTKINVFKQTLTGAKFSISGDKQDVVIINSEIFEKITGEVPEGTTVYYRLKDGTYTTTAPDAQIEGAAMNQEAYDSITDKYQKIIVVDKDVSSTNIAAEGYVDENGILTFDGLAEGIYTITELVAPEGYNLLTNPIYIKVEYKEEIRDENSQVIQNAGWTAIQVDADGNALPNAANGVTVNGDGVATISVINKNGFLMPSTGGIGTTIFYLLGGLLTVGAGVVLITKKIMKNRE